MTTAEDLSISLSRDIVDFAGLHKLSQREVDVFLLLLNRISTSSDIASFLGLSANTVSNHLKSILTKSRCHSKTELLGSFIEFQIRRTQGLRAFVRRPRVMVVAQSLNEARDLATALQQRGLETYSSQPTEAGQQIIKRRIESIVHVCGNDIENAIDFFTRIRKEFMEDVHTFPLTVRHLIDIDSKLFSEVTEIIPSHFTADQLAITIVEYNIPDPYVRNRFIRTDTHFEIDIDGKATGTAENIGQGGMFVSFDGTGPKDESLMREKSIVKIAFTLPDGQGFAIPARVIWVRPQPRTFLRAGMGLEFIDLSQDTSQRIKEFVRRQKTLPKI